MADEAEDQVTCYNCDDKFDKEDTREAIGNVYCESCYDNCIGSCDGCCTEVERDMLEIVEGNWAGPQLACTRCYLQESSNCDGCGVRIWHDELQMVGHGEGMVCSRCLDYNYHYCERCDVYESESCEEESVFPWDYRPGRFTLHGKNTDKHKNLFLGLELEISGEAYDIKEKVECLLGDDTYLKSDNSIEGEGGAEIVTHPASLEVWHERQDKWRSLLESFQGTGNYFATGDQVGCGLHIHLTRNPFTTRILYHFLKLIYGYPKFSELVSGRTRGLKEHHYCGLGEVHYVDIVKRAAGKRRASRMSAVNLQNVDTVEVRMFTGSFDIARIYGCLEFCDALYAFSSSERNAKGITPTSFAMYAADQGKRYANLTNLLQGAPA